MDTAISINMQLQMAWVHVESRSRLVHICALPDTHDIYWHSWQTYSALSPKLLQTGTFGEA